MNKLEQAIAIANDMLLQYGIKDWKVQINNSRTTLAIVTYSKKTLAISKRLIMAASIEDFNGVVGHEIAHIITGRIKGHGAEFQAVCKKLEIPSSFSCDTYPIYINSYKYVCDFHGAAEYSNSKKELFCKDCALEKLKLVKLRIVKNEIMVKAW